MIARVAHPLQPQTPVRTETRRGPERREPGERHLSGPFHNYGGIGPPMHPTQSGAGRGISGVAYSRYCPSSRLAGRAPRRPRCLTVIVKRTT